MLTTDGMYILDDLYRTSEDSFCSGNSKAIEPDGFDPLHEAHRTSAGYPIVKNESRKYTQPSYAATTCVTTAYGDLY